MGEVTISVQNLTMTYRVPVREAGLRAAFGSLLHRKFREVEAVHDISFGVASGEVVGFIGPNGAGKTTTLKILSGVLHPMAGDVRVLAYIPWQREYLFLRQIAMIRGSRPLGAPGELTVLDALHFQKLIYEVSDADFKRNLAELVEMLNLEPLLQRQVRALSLGERMRSGLAWSLLYHPRVLFLDEPTIGLDVSATTMMRRFLADYCDQNGVTVLLTSHYMADVETLCKRVILIDKGQLAYEGDIAALSNRLAPYKMLKIVLGAPAMFDWQRFGELISQADDVVYLRIPREDVPLVTSRILKDLQVTDLSVEDPTLESVIDQVYREGVYP